MLVCNLIMVTGDNNNKFYNMVVNGNIIDVTYGRVGCKEQKAQYPISKWESLKHSKLKKGYKEVESLVKILLEKARNKIASNYMVSYKDVTQKQLDEAQKILNSVLEYRVKRVEVEELNRRLLSLYTLIPRKMKKVQDYLLESFDTTRLKEIIKNEQDLLDTLSTQVIQNTQASESENKSILEVAGLEIVEITDKEKELIKKKLGSNEKQFVRAFKVINKVTQERFDNDLKDKENKTTDLLWHGSRTENWWSILSTGLMIRPSGAVYTGSMFGDALYFADKAQKSIGYTSLSSSYWANGSDDKAYLALFEVHIGKQKHYYEHKSECSHLDYNKIHREGFDSVYAHAGKSLRNNEYMVYRKEQCTVKYIVEISK